MVDIPYSHLNGFSDMMFGRVPPKRDQFPFWQQPGFTFGAWNALINILGNKSFDKHHQKVIKYIHCRYGADTLDALKQHYGIRHHNCFRLFSGYPAGYFDVRQLPKGSTLSSLVDGLIPYLKLDSLLDKWNIQALCGFALELQELEELVLNVIDNLRFTSERPKVRSSLVKATKEDVRNMIGEKLWQPARRQVYGQDTETDEGV